LCTTTLPGFRRVLAGLAQTEHSSEEGVITITERVDSQMVDGYT